MSRLLGFFAAALALRAAAQTTGTIEGTVGDALTQKPLADAVVIAQSLALQGERTAVTDGSGHFTIALLPVGDYTLTVRREAYQPFIERQSLGLRLNETLKVNLLLVPEKIAAGETIDVVGERPSIDVGSPQSGGVVSNEQMQLIPYGRVARNFEAVATSIPGVQEDARGFSMRGSGSPEGNYLIDGINVTDPSVGIQGTSLLQDFIQEVEIKTGGYQAEYGRSSGGIINAVIKSGGNELHGSVFANWSPLELPRRTAVFPNSAIAAQESQRQSLDFGAELGGPILKDRLWFFAGAAPQLSALNEDRLILARTDDGTGNPVRDAGGTPVVHEVARQRYTRTTTAYQFVGKLTWLAAANHDLTLSAFGNPTRSSGAFADPSSVVSPPLLRGNEGTFLREELVGSSDVSLRYTGKLFDNTLLVEASASYHRQSGSTVGPTVRTTPIDGVSAAMLRDTPRVAWFQQHNLLDPLFDDATTPASQRGLAACAVQPNGFDPCPVTGYVTGGAGALPDELLDRLSGGLKLTSFFDAAGYHRLRYGADTSLDSFHRTRTVSGGAGAFEIFTGVLIMQQNGHPDPTQPALPAFDPNRPGHLLDDELDTVTRNVSAAFYAQDTWTLFDRVTLDLGVRVERQLTYADRSTLDASGLPIRGPQISLWNAMPRLGAIYEFTGRGLSNVYASYGRFYEYIPLDLASTVLSALSVAGRAVDARRCQPPAGSLLKVDPRFCANTAPPGTPAWSFFGNGGAFETVDPNLQGQYVDEEQLGAQYQIWKDAVVGLDYVHRQIGRVVEDLSTNEGSGFFLSNPGEPGKLGYQLATPSGVIAVPPPRRVYDGVTLWARKTFSEHYLASASWTCSSLRGNYPGLFDSNGGLLPNSSVEYDLASAFPNRSGPLPGDVPNSFKVDAGYQTDLSPSVRVQAGANLRADQGQPLSYLGAHELYGPGQIFILPRGSAGRLPWIWALNLRGAVSYRLGGPYVASLSLDVFNATNNRAATAADQNYTLDRVQPIVNGRVADLKGLRTNSGGAVTLNSSFLTPTAYQLPLSARLGAKLAF